LSQLRRYGIVLQDSQTGRQSTTVVGLTEQLTADDHYDLVLVLVRRNQLPEVLPRLAVNHPIPAFLFMVNNASGPEALIQTVGRERVLLGFAGAGGTREGHVITTIILSGESQPTTIGELDGQTTPRLEVIADALRAAGFPTVIEAHMDAWLKTHVAVVSPIANAIYLAGGSNYRLAAQNIPLDAPKTLPGSAAETTPEYTWLALQVLAGLSALIELPISIPHAELETAEARLTAEERAELDYLAQNMLEGLQQAIRGRDAFFPAPRPANEAWLENTRTALNEERCLDIAYQSLVDNQPSSNAVTRHYSRRVEPLRLEQRGSLYYLHAYCYLAEANRIFRLDRIHACELAECTTDYPE
jgi:hypothetical protein